MTQADDSHRKLQRTKTYICTSATSTEKVTVIASFSWYPHDAVVTSSSTIRDMSDEKLIATQQMCRCIKDLKGPLKAFQPIIHYVKSHSSAEGRTETLIMRTLMYLASELSIKYMLNVPRPGQLMSPYVTFLHQTRLLLCCESVNWIIKDWIQGHR